MRQVELPAECHLAAILYAQDLTHLGIAKKGGKAMNPKGKTNSITKTARIVGILYLVPGAK
jgi:hypothetical protein